MLKIRVKRHVLSVLYSIRQQDTPKSRDSRAVFLKSREKLGSGSKSRKSRKSRDTGQPGYTLINVLKACCIKQRMCVLSAKHKKINFQISLNDVVTWWLYIIPPLLLDQMSFQMLQQTGHWYVNEKPSVCTFASYLIAAAYSMATLWTLMPCLIIFSHCCLRTGSQYELARSRRPGEEWHSTNNSLNTVNKSLTAYCTHERCVPCDFRSSCQFLTFLLYFLNIMKV